MTACKSYINLIDSVLLPFDPATVATLPASAAGAAAVLGAGGCAVQPNSMVAGQEIKAGAANRQVG